MPETPAADRRERLVTYLAGASVDPAVHELRWNNPKLHTPDRRKVWLACDEHRQSLADFLSARQFLKEIAPH